MFYQHIFLLLGYRPNPQIPKCIHNFGTHRKIHFFTVIRSTKDGFPKCAVKIKKSVHKLLPNPRILKVNLYHCGREVRADQK